MLKISILEMSSNITNVRLHSHLPGPRSWYKYPMVITDLLHYYTVRFHYDMVNTLRLRQNGRHFQMDFLNENVWITINISLKFVPRGPINNIPTLVQVMAWRRPGDKPLSEPMLVRLTTHICVTRPQWVNLLSNTNNKYDTPEFIIWDVRCSLYTTNSWIHKELWYN